MWIISINIRGLEGHLKWKYLKGIISKEGVDMMYIQETKLERLQNEICYNLWKDNNIEWFHKEAMNGSRGILTMWHKDSFTCDKQLTSQWFIVMVGKYKGSNKNNDVLV